MVDPLSKMANVVALRPSTAAVAIDCAALE